ncbi:MAG: PAS domain S-box protein, partial [Desulfosudaceae bacterium]
METKQPGYEALKQRVLELENSHQDLRQELETLRQSQAMLVRSEQVAEVGSWEWDIASDEVTWSEGLYVIFQLDPAEKPRRWSEHGVRTHPDDMARLRRASVRAVEESVPYEMEIRIFRRDGEPRWCLARGFPKKREDGQVVGLYGTIQDITDRKQVEAKRDEYEALLTSTLAAVDSLLVLIDRDYRIVLCNWKDHEWVLERQRQDHPRCYQVFKNRDKPCNNCPPQQTFVDGRIRWYEDQNPIDGSFKKISAIPIFGDDGRVAYVLENVRDVTRRKATEEALHLQSLTLNQIQDRVTVTDLEGNITYVNDAECAMLGRTREELLGRHVSAYGEDPEAGATQAEIIARTRRDGTWQGEIVNYDSNGHPCILDCRTHLVRNEAGKAIALCGVATDITARKRAEAERARLEEQVHHAQRLESIGRLAGGAAHDLNNLLTPILGYGEILLSDLAPDDFRRQAIEDIMLAGERARDLVRQLLAFSRKQTLEFSEVNLNSLLTGFKNLLRRTIREDVAIHMNLAETLPLVKGDVGQLEQVVMNLAINAQDAMPDGGDLAIVTAPAEVTIDAENRQLELPAGRYVRMVISDTGCGMDEEVLEHLFEPFFTTKDVNQGTGLGLASVYGIVKQH